VTGSQRSKALMAVAALSFGAVGAALVTQYGLDMQPCPWCVLQRLIFAVLGLVALIAMAWQAPALRRLWPLALLLLASCGTAAALWQHFVAAVGTSCNLTLADRIVSGLQLDALLPSVFQATASCADAAVNLLGVPYEFWSLGLFAAIEVAAVWLFIRDRAQPA
jgi:disulfide bond formation protein DsbB